MYVKCHHRHDSSFVLFSYHKIFRFNKGEVGRSIVESFRKRESVNLGSSVVISTGNDLLARGPHNDGVFELGGVAALDVAERRVGLDDALLPEVLESHQVAGLPDPVEPSPAEGEGAEVLVDRVEELLRALKAERNVPDVEVLHVVARLHVVVDKAEKRQARIWI